MMNTNAPQPGKRIPRRFFERDPATVARELIGTCLIKRSADGSRIGGRIIETEAYLATGDPASHSARGLTKRNRSMFARAGTLYVYAIHAKFCMNVSTEEAGTGSAVLIRAVEPIWGLDVMRAARGQELLRRLTGGPAMLCQALGITTEQDGIDLVTCRWLGIYTDMSGAPEGGASGAEQLRVAVSGRIGVRQGADLPLRFYLEPSARKERNRNEKTR